VNVVLIAIDTLRAGRLECYGYGRRTSPALAGLAREGILYESFSAPSIPTDPSFASLYTGLPDYGHRIAGVIPPRPVAEGAPWLPQMFADAGYFTCALDSLQGHGEFFARGWQDYSWPGMGHDKEAGVKRNAEVTTGAAVDLLDRLPSGDPFLMFVHYWDPHTPYLPPAPYDGMFYEGDPTDPRHTSMRDVRAFPGPGTGWIDADVTDAQYVAAQYDAEIAYNSEHLLALFDELKRRGLYEDSLIVAFADHGEVLTGHEGHFDHHGLYEDNIHVPLIIRLPKGEGAGRRVPDMAAMTDLPVTLLRAAGLAVPPQMEGLDLLEVAAGRGESPHGNLFLGEGTWQVKRGVRTRDWKFIRAASDSYEHNFHGTAPRELYNLESDPGEQANLVNVEPLVAAELERRLDDWLVRMKDRYGWEDPLLEDGPTLLKPRDKDKLTPASEIL